MTRLLTNLDWFTKGRRAQNVDDYETWNEGGVTPTLNVMDNTGDTRATVLIIDGTRVGDVRIYDNEIMPSVIARYGTGGGNVPMVFKDEGIEVFPIQDGREIEKAQNGLGVADDGAPAYTVDTHATQAVAYSIREEAQADNFSATETDVALSLNAHRPSVQSHHAQIFIAEEVPVSFDTQFGSNANAFEGVSPTLKHSQQPPSVAFDEFNNSLSEDIHHTLRAGTKQSTGVIAPTLSASNNPSRSPQSSEVTAQVDAVMNTTAVVRRLTPTECERLQGFPDGWTDGQSDSHRYKQLGNAVAVPCVAQIIASLVKHAQNSS